MTLIEAMNIIKKEKLQGYNLDGKNIKENEVGVQFVGEKWIVYCTDERASYRIIKEYTTQEDAIKHAIDCLRINEKIKKRFNV